jgi:hypothetical protein
MLRSLLRRRSRAVRMTGGRAATQDSRVSCETFAEAERVAHICAAYQQPLTLIARRDAQGWRAVGHRGARRARGE